MDEWYSVAVSNSVAVSVLDYQFLTRRLEAGYCPGIIMGILAEWTLTTSSCFTTP